MDFKELTDQGYFDLREIPGRGIVGLYRFAFTVGLVYGIREYDYTGRYCYESLADARTALNEWDGVDDPSGQWIKHKGRIEYSNINNINFNPLYDKSRSDRLNEVK